MYEKLYAALISTGADISICDMNYIYEADGRQEPMPPLPREELAGRQIYERVELAPEGWRYVSACDRLYRGEIFRSVRFREGKIHEDELSVIDIYENCRRVAVISQALYWDVGRPGSIMTSSAAIRRLDAMDAYLERSVLYRDRGWRDLSRAVLYKAYKLLWSTMNKVDVRQNKAVIGPLVSRVSRAQIRQLDIRGAWLWLGYLRKCRGSKP